MTFIIGPRQGSEKFWTAEVYGEQNKKYALSGGCMHGAHHVRLVDQASGETWTKTGITGVDTLTDTFLIDWVDSIL